MIGLEVVFTKVNEAGGIHGRKLTSCARTISATLPTRSPSCAN